MRALGIAAVGAALTLIVIAGPSFATSLAPSARGSGDAGAVFTMTNALSGNEIVTYARAGNGDLTWVGNFSTGGSGTGASLADQGSLAITANGRWLLAVDAGSNQVSVLGVTDGPGGPSLRLTDVVASGGVLPVSVTIFASTVYVLNLGDAISAGNIAGFALSGSGQLAPLAGSTQALSTSGATGAAQIAFGPTGTLLAVTEKSTNLIDVYDVNARGIARPGTFSASDGSTPYGFAFTPRGQLVVSEAASGSLSSYRVHAHGYFEVISGSVLDFETAPCWVVVTPSGAIAYTTNADSDSISSYAVAANGRLALLQSVAAVTGAAPTDLALVGNGQLLYVHDSAAGAIEGYAVAADGALTWIGTTGALPGSDEGLVTI